MWKRANSMSWLTHESASCLLDFLERGIDSRARHKQQQFCDPEFFKRGNLLGIVKAELHRTGSSFLLFFRPRYIEATLLAQSSIHNQRGSLRNRRDENLPCAKSRNLS